MAWRSAVIVAGFSACFALFACPAPAFAGQSATASISGAIRDSSDAALPSSTISLTSLETTRTWQTRAAADGSFQFLGVSPGRYRIEVSCDGFAGTERIVELTLDERRELIIPLSLSRIAQSVSVVAAQSPLIDLSKIALGRTITAREIDNLPIPSGLLQDFLSLATLSPGIAADLGDSGVGAAGQAGNSNTFYLDGLDSDSAIAGGAAVNMPLGAVKEFRVVSNHFSVEFGQASGAVVNIVTQSGSNTPAARVYYYQQSGAWNATSATARRVGATDPGQQQEIVGGYWGGPIVRRRVFFFGSPEQVLKRATYVNTSPVILSFRPTDPLSWPVETHAPKAFGRSDIEVSPANVLTLRATWNGTTSSDTQRESLSAHERGRALDNSVRILGLLDRHLIGSTAVDEGRVQWTHSHFQTPVDSYCPGCAALNYSNIKLGGPNNAPQLFRADRADAANVITWLPPWGDRRHTLKAGVEVDFAQQRGLNPINTSGTYQFAPEAPPFDASNPASYPARFTRNIGDAHFRVHETIVSVFGQDEWQVRRRVSLTAGVRWDHTTWPAQAARDDAAPRVGIAIDPGGGGVTAFRAAAGRYYDDSQLMTARDAQTGFLQTTISNPGFQGSPSTFDPAGPNPRRSGPAVLRLSLNGATVIQTPYTDQVSVGVQHQVGGTHAVTADLVRALGQRLPVGADLNYPDPSTHLRPNPDVEQILATETRGQSWYTGVAVGVRGRLTGRYGYSIAYTRSRADNDTDGRTALPQDQTNLLADRGPTRNDARHRLAASGVVTLPFTCQLSALVTARSALPYNITTGTDDNKDGVSTTDRPPGIGRNSARGSPSFNADVRFSKALSVGRARLDLLVEAFNVTSHANWSDYNGVRSAGFGVPATAAPPRQLQLGARFNF